MNQSEKILLEVTVALPTQTKLFCTCPIQPVEEGANRTICPRCAGLPGALPVLNQQALELAVKAGLLLGCQVHLHSAFQRRLYSHPAAARHYQLGQFETPVCTGGAVGAAGEVQVLSVGLMERLSACLDGGQGELLLDDNLAGQPMLRVVAQLEAVAGEQVVAAVGQIAALLELGRVCRFQKGRYLVAVHRELCSGEQRTIRGIPTMDDLAQLLQRELTAQQPAAGEWRFDPRQGALAAGVPAIGCFAEPDLCSVRLTQSQVDALRAQLGE